MTYLAQQVPVLVYKLCFQQYKWPRFFSSRNVLQFRSLFFFTLLLSSSIQIHQVNHYSQGPPSTKVYKNQNFDKSDDTLVNICERNQRRRDPISAPKIRWATIPQNDYTNAQCRLWITAQLRAYYVFIPRSTAISIASGFDGSGFTMFAMEREDWVDMLGVHGHIIGFLIRRILWNQKKATKAGFSLGVMNDLRGEYKAEIFLEEDLNWSGLYPIK
ncbi:6c96b70d-832a-4d3c-bbde-28332249f3f4 [Sclerotinia trifoliorum]|uniref:6c96b70d-832a-4d3c-bbde-28332249f3f4 n=1 Tax=Sclerotinia trifoliorum TaxID=28548 RepID=A0A8H2ZSM9_9HELO|nr:6c96b70d-832a-4d3c-bbde-28332249f3f4 [Sclerotinia trifoliorum]